MKIVRSLQPLCARTLLAAAACTAFTAQAADNDAALSQLDVATVAAKRAMEMLGIQLWGYMRSGAYYSQNGMARGHYGLGELGYNRLGNEGDHYLEFGIGKKWDVGGAKVGTYWMPYLYNASCCNVSGTKQVYADISNLSFAPELTFWAGQRYHRIQDVHIIDNWLMEDGDNFGGGVDGIKVGGGTLNLAVYNEGNTDNSKTTSNAYRFNLQVRNLPVGPDGTLNLTAAVIDGKFNDKKTSLAVGALYNQKIGVLTNSLFLQSSNGHASLNGKFYALNGTSTTTTTNGNPFICTVQVNADGSCPIGNIRSNPATTTTTTTVYNPGAKQFRVVDAINWQSGTFGGQALVGYQTKKVDGVPGTDKNFTVGGRLSFGVAANVKLYTDANIATLKPADGSSTQRLDKETVGVALAPNTEFWTRPEVRLYASRVGGNEAVKSSQFNGRSSAFLAGLQVEAWW